ncbi:MAG TPA: Uma2 family endonuclease [Pyrinomonadaceae bacterium]|nr:Uma2 family endonuclease [Pyrinomonadaceae bacterium]
MTTVLETPKQIEQKVLLHGVSWETYERLLAEHEESSGAHFAYDRGNLEIMILSLKHEKLKARLMSLVEAAAETLGVDYEAAGSTTFRRKDLQRGFEPDACYYMTHAALIRQKDEIDLTTDPPPELVIEIDITSPSLDKFPIFAALGVAEVWRCDGERVHFFRLGEAGYAGVAESAALPGVNEETVNRLLEASRKMKRADWLRFVRESAKGRE